MNVPIGAEQIENVKRTGLWRHASESDSQLSPVVPVLPVCKVRYRRRSQIATTRHRGFRELVLMEMLDCDVAKESMQPDSEVEE